MRLKWYTRIIGVTTVLVSALLVLAPAPAAAQAVGKPRVVVITMGGTIASRSDGAPMTPGAALINAVPELAKYADIRVEEFTRVGSSQLTPDHWLRLSKRINALFGEDRELAAIVITHGTDTMEETAFFLNLTVNDARPVVLTGSMRGSDEISADGPANLLNAVRVAVSRQSVGQGVLVVMNEDISDARDLQKTDNRRVQTFQSPQVGFLGSANPDTVVFARRVLRPHTTASEFDVSRVDSLPSVEMLTDYSGFDGALMSAAVGLKPRGVVLATFAGGRMSAGGRLALQRASKASVPAVIASRVPNGRMVGNPLGELPGVMARDLPPNKARVLLMLALTRTADLREIQRLFDAY